MVLDQGYWPSTGMTPPDDAALRRDVELTKAMGFNGARKHQKVEDPRYLYWADHLGLLVWEEMPSAYYDCMDELAAFAGAPPEMTERENELFERADLVFTGGQALFEAKRHRHPSVHPFPSSVDIAHFSRARRAQRDPADQAFIARPRLGFYGVIDERLDVGLIGRLAALRPEWQIVLVGPVVKIDPAMLPRAANIHYLGPKPYDLLPAYLSGWDVAMLPFDRNDATRYISPTKTPEYLAAGRPVVSTTIRDVVRTYGMRGLARIADSPEEFAAAIEAALADDPVERRREADAFLTRTSWDGTWARMYQLIASVMTRRAAGRAAAAAFTEPGVA